MNEPKVHHLFTSNSSIWASCGAYGNHHTMTHDLDAVTCRTCLRIAGRPAPPPPDSRDAEITSLRADVARLQGEAARERAAVVAWLRDGAGNALAMLYPLASAADAIERGEHTPIVPEPSTPGPDDPPTPPCPDALVEKADRVSRG